MREVRNQISIQMGDVEKKVKKAFIEQLEAVYEKGKTDIDRMLQEQKGRNAEWMRQQETAAQIKSCAVSCWKESVQDNRDDMMIRDIHQERRTWHLY